MCTYLGIFNQIQGLVHVKASSLTLSWVSGTCTLSWVSGTCYACFYLLIGTFLPYRESSWEVLLKMHLIKRMSVVL